MNSKDKAAPVIHGDLVLLRPPTAEDFKLYFRMVNDETMSYLSDDRYFQTYEEKHFKQVFQKYILKEQRQYLPKIIVRREDGVKLGQIHAGNIDRDNLQCYIGFQVLPEFQGKGYGSDALSAFVDHLFGVRKFKRVAAEVYDYNGASIAILEKTGFIREGRLRDAVIRPDNWHDKFLYAILRQDWENEDQVLGYEQSERIIFLFRLRDAQIDAPVTAETLDRLQNFYRLTGDAVSRTGGQLIWYREDTGLALFSPNLRDRIKGLSDFLAENNILSIFREEETVTGPMGYPPAEHDALYGGTLPDMLKELDGII